MEKFTDDAAQGSMSSADDAARSSAGSAPGAGEDELLGVIDHVQAQLNSLKATHAQRDQLRARLESWDRSLAERERELTAHAQTLAAEQSRLEELKSFLEGEKQTLAEARATLERDLQALADSQRQAGAELESRRAELEARAEELARKEEQLTAAAGQVGDAESRIADITARMVEMEREGRVRAEELRQAHSAMQAAGARAEALAAELTRSQEQAGQEHASLAAQIESLKGDLARAGEAQSALIEELQQREAQLEQANPSGGAEESQRAAALEREIAELSEELAGAQRARALAQEEASRWRQRAESSGDGEADGDIPAEVGETVMRRWNRLRLMRSLLREQAEKIQEAGQALRSRYEECEAILAQRDELAKTRAALAEMQRRLASASGKGRSGSMQRALTCASAVVIAFASLLAIAWAVGGQIAPATYAASTVLKADHNGAGPDLLAEWQKYHEGLLEDPAFMEMAADRMNRRGIVSLGTAAMLAERLERDMAFQSAQDGTLTIELRGGGRKTERELDVLVTAMASQSNATRGRRPDGLGAVIEQPATAGEPVEDTRMVYAGGIFAGGSGLFAVMGLALWRRMSAAKASFEKEHAVIGAEDASWNEAPKVLARPRA